MSDILEYKGYYAKPLYSIEDKVIYGKLLGIGDLITFESEDASTVEMEFQDAVDDYLAFCKDIKKEPEKAYKGSFNIRVKPEIHKNAVITAAAQDITLNELVEAAMEEYLDSCGIVGNQKHSNQNIVFDQKYYSEDDAFFSDKADDIGFEKVIDFMSHKLNVEQG